jgi:hypothetical protein
MYAGCFLLSLPFDAPRHAAAAASPISFSFDFSNKNSYNPNNLRFEGDTRVNGDLVDLTCNNLAQSLKNCTGRMSYGRLVPFYDTATRELTSFATQFTFRIVLPAQQSMKGDGMAFFLASYPSELLLGTDGKNLGLTNCEGGIGYCAARFVAVEFDTFKNKYDPQESSDHIGIDLSSVDHSVNTKSLPRFSLSGNMMASINFNSSTRKLVARLHFADNTSMDTVEVSANLTDPFMLLPSEVAVGFSASTGTHMELHQILSWSFNSTLAPKKRVSVGTCLSLCSQGIFKNWSIYTPNNV